MSFSLDHTMAAIKATQQHILDGDKNVVVAVVTICHNLVEIRENTKRGEWQECLKDLGYDKRGAERMLKVGRSEWTPMRLSESPFLALLPTDVMKLEWLLRLNEEQLGIMLKFVNPKTASRTKIIEAVHGALGETYEPSKPPRQLIDGEKLKRTWETAFDRILDAMDSLDPSVGQEIRGQLLSEMEQQFEEVREAFAESTEDEGSEVESDDEATATDSNEEAQPDELAEAVSLASTNNGRPSRPAASRRSHREPQMVG